jgi:hypothetical protein
MLITRHPSLGTSCPTSFFTLLPPSAIFRASYRTEAPKFSSSQIVTLNFPSSYGEKFKVGRKLIANCDEFS